MSVSVLSGNTVIGSVERSDSAGLITVSGTTKTLAVFVLYFVIFESDVGGYNCSIGISYFRYLALHRII